MRRSVPILVCLLLLVCIPARTQSTNATITGSVNDRTNRAVPAADVEIVNDATGVHYSVATNREGIYNISVLPPGKYTVQASKIGFKTVITPDVTLNVQGAVSLNLVLPVGAASETITVDAGSTNINTTDASVSTVVDRTFVGNMPLNGRSFQSLLTLAPGVNQVPTYAGSNSVGYSGDIVVNGQRTEANYFTVDGVSANTGTQPGTFGYGAGNAGGLPGLTAVGSTQSLVSIDALEEFRSSTSTFSAEYGRTPGGNFAFNTRSGTNAFHGSAFDFFRNDALDANNWFNNHLAQPKTKERQNNFGGTLGGPLFWPSRRPQSPSTHFFFSYEGLRLSSPQPAQEVAVPTDALRAQAPTALQPVLNAFPRTNTTDASPYAGFGYYIQSVSYPSTLDNTSIRIDQRLGSKATIFGRYADSPSATTTYTRAIRQAMNLYNRSLTLGATFTPTSHQSNDLRFNFTRTGGTLGTTSTNLGGATPFDLSSIPGPNGSFPQTGYLYVVFTYASFTNLTLKSQPSAQNQFNVTDTHAWLMGRHNLKAGVDWRRLATTVQPYSAYETVAYSTSQQIINNAPYSATAQSQAPNAIQPTYLNFSAFLQDEWKPTQRLSLSLGWRWDVNPAPTNGLGPVPYTLNQISDLTTATLAPQGTPLWQTDWSGHAPRIGMAYVLHDNGTRLTVLRAGAGIFYDLGSMLGANGYSGLGYINRLSYTTASFPLTSSQVAVHNASVQPPYSQAVFAFDPHLKLPYAIDYSLAVEQGFSRHDSVTLSYVGSQSHRLLTDFITYPYNIGNKNFASGTVLQVAQGRAAANYSSLQAKYQREMSHGVQVLASYTWAHSIDNASNNFAIYQLLRASSDYDIRHSFQAALTYQPVYHLAHPLLGALGNGWAMDLRVQARTALPVNVIGSQVLDTQSGIYTYYQPNLVVGQPLYVYGPTTQYPGGRAINYNALSVAPSGTQGNMPRNGARGFGTLEFDPAIRREVPVSEHVRIQFRAEAFNIANHPSFGAIYSQLSYGPNQFGRAYTTLNNVGTNLNSLYQPGGPRSLQLSLKLLF